VVDLDVWEAAKGVAGKRARSARAAAAAAEREAAVRGELAAKLGAQVGARAACNGRAAPCDGSYHQTLLQRLAAWPLMPCSRRDQSRGGRQQ